MLMRTLPKPNYVFKVRTSKFTLLLALKKSINTKIVQIGNVLTYTLKVWSESSTNATGVEV
jgi:hypothetical protein